MQLRSKQAGIAGGMPAALNAMKEMLQNEPALCSAGIARRSDPR